MEKYNSDGNISAQYSERQKKDSEASWKTWTGGGGGFGITELALVVVGGMFGIGVILAVLSAIANLGLLLGQFPLYLLVVAAVVVVFIIVIMTELGCFGSLLVLAIGAGGVGYLGSKGISAIYGSRDKYYPSEYCGDYICKLPDGSMPKLYEKRKGRGEEAAVLTPGQWVKVNGIAFSKKEYNITTQDGATGWVPAEAFPKDASAMLFDRFRNDFSTDREIAIDRQVAAYAEIYLTAKGMNDATLRQAVRVNAKTPFLHLSRKEFKETGDTLFTESGMTVTLERIAYPAKHNITMIHLSVTKSDNDFGHQPLYDTFESLAVKDLDTGETYNVIPGRYRNHEWGTDGKRNVVFFFPSFRSRHFSLTHTAHPEVESRGAGFFRKLASVTPGLPGYDYFTDWNFAEVRVR